jgi:predicted amidohydrolase YtcJ
MAAYTTGAAFAEFAEKQKGKLEPGMLADFVVLDQDITAARRRKSWRRKFCARWSAARPCTKPMKHRVIW